MNGSDTATDRRRGMPFVPALLLVLALLDLRGEIRLLLDHFTITTLLTAIRTHLLAFTILALLPSLWRHYRRHP
jgi:hypothetical protein